jgi:ribonucleoside-diphosphate reductase alpha chain
LAKLIGQGLIYLWRKIIKMSKEIYVTKRNGKKELFQLQKWQAQIAKVCEGVADVSPSMIEIAASPHFYNGMTTTELDQIALRAMVGLIDEEANPLGNVNYQYVAGKQRVSMLRKDVFGQYEPPHLFEIVKKNISLELYTSDLLTWYSEEDWAYLNKQLDHGKDELLTYAAVEQLADKYLVRNRATGNIVESPQIRYMIAAATAFHAEEKDRLKWVKDFYHAASDGIFTLATPVLAGLGTKTKQFSSCVLLRTDDTLKSIFATGQIMADYASKRAGIGLEIGRLRPLGAPIRGGEVMHTGILPFLKKWYGDLRSCSQGGLRNASATVNLPIWHYQFDDYIVLKNNKGTEENRIRQLDYCVVLNSFFWRRFKERKNITFFDPNQVPDLYEAFYADSIKFEKMYVEYEQRTDISKKVESAEVVFKDWLITERMETGRIYILNIDNVSNQGPFDTNIHPIYQTNLCCLTGDMLVTVSIDGKQATIPMDKVTELFDSGTKLNVMSKDLETSRVEFKPIKAAAQTKKNQRIIKITDVNTGKFVKCTLDHRIFTKNRGWVEAQFITETDKLDIH